MFAHYIWGAHYGGECASLLMGYLECLTSLNKNINSYGICTLTLENSQNQNLLVDLNIQIIWILNDAWDLIGSMNEWAIWKASCIVQGFEL